MSKNLRKAQDVLEQIASKTSSFLEKITSASEKADSKNSSALFGAAGGILGSLIGIVGAPYIGVSVLLLSTLLTSLGILGGILIYRGRDGIALEQMISQNSIAAEEVLRRIQSLPENAPDNVLDDLWNNYRALNGTYKNQSFIALSPSKKKGEGLMLPNKEDES